MRWWILQDNQSSVSLFYNPDLVSNIWTADTGDMLLSTNGGLLVTKNKADVPEWGEVWYNAKAITNIFSFAEMADSIYKITYNSANGDAFQVHMPQGRVVIRFERHPNDLYVYKPNKRSIKIQPRLQLLNTVEENKSVYTQRQFDQAKRAGDLYHALGTPLLHDSKLCCE